MPVGEPPNPVGQPVARGPHRVAGSRYLIENLLVAVADRNLCLRAGPVAKPDAQNVGVYRQGLLGVLRWPGQPDMVIPFLAETNGIGYLTGSPDRAWVPVPAFRLGGRQPPVSEVSHDHLAVREHDLRAGAIHHGSRHGYD